MRIFTRHISLVAGGTQGKMFFLKKTAEFQGKAKQLLQRTVIV